jgi:hypothetical protein
MLFIFIEMSTPIGSFIFEFKEYALEDWILQTLATLITISIGFEIGHWINNR